MGRGRPRDTGCRGEEQRRRRPFAGKRACGASSCWTAALRSAVRQARGLGFEADVEGARSALSKRAAVDAALFCALGWILFWHICSIYGMRRISARLTQLTFDKFLPKPRKKRKRKPGAGVPHRKREEVN